MTQSHDTRPHRTYEANLVGLDSPHMNLFIAHDIDEATARARKWYRQWFSDGTLQVIATDASESWTGPLK